MQISPDLREPSEESMAAGFFPSADGTVLHASWVAARGSPRSGIVLVHGYGEHAGRYRKVADRLAGAGHAVMSFDYRGHGKAEGPRGHCERFTDFTDDLRAACARAAAATDLPLVLMAQSHGGLIALRALLDDAGGGAPLAGVKAAIFTCPFLALKMRVPAPKVWAARVASRFWPRLALPSGLDPDLFSHDAKVAEIYRADPLNHHLATARWFTETLAAQAFVAGRADRLAIPSLWLCAGDDRVVDSDVTRRVYARAGGDKQLIVFDGLFHEILNEVDADEVLASVETWLARHGLG